MDPLEFDKLQASRQKAAGLTTSPTIERLAALEEISKLRSSYTEEVTIQKQIMVQTQFVALHCWPEAPQVVSYLRSPHRHVFKVVLMANVNKGNREVEFHMALRDLNRVIADLFTSACGEGVYSSGSYLTNGLSTVSLSCEDMAQLIGEKMAPFCDVASVLVAEDGENGGLVSFHRRLVPTVPAGRL